MDTKTLCLGALLLGDKTGYDIKKRFEESFGFFLDVAPSGIYRALNDLETAGDVEASLVQQTGRPNKKMFKPTPAGVAAFDRALAQTPARHRVHSELLFLLMFAERVSPAKIEDALNHHTGELTALIDQTDAWLKEEGGSAPPGLRFVARFGLDIMRAELESLERRRSDLERAPPEAQHANPDLEPVA